ncbi:MAG: heparinase II/III-family protein [Verrucomicrobiales bacterium]|nr:heparinase II/III-family protein [Verrucomicrobiales bacterium]
MTHGWGWYWHRLRAMKPEEIRERVAQKLRQRADMRRLPAFDSVPIPPAGSAAWPVLPPKETAPDEFLKVLQNDRDEILAGRWLAFGHLRIQVDNPPSWFTDYAAGRHLPTARPGFRLNHRQLPRGADIKLVWELSRWSHIVRLAQAAWLLDDKSAAERCVSWLEDWVRRNPPYLGWNWTSALEAGMRLVNFGWLDALLGAAGIDPSRLARLRQRILPAHLWYTWRHRSFGSSANNHLLGELAGLITALSRWPELEKWATPLEDLVQRWEREVLAQFAADGGNREQALNYQLYAWELCWHTRNAIRARGRGLSAPVEDRLGRAADFFVTVQVPEDPWDYGDSDSASVTPLAMSDADGTGEWYRWKSDSTAPSVLRWWLGDPPKASEPAACVPAAEDWLVFPDSGQAVCWSGHWQLRWDLSPLGYLSMAAHGHLDALHLSLWLDNVALIVDPGTGAYYGDTRLRGWLASWAAHNGPRIPHAEFPRRLGPFLWESHHAIPKWRVLDPDTMMGELALPQGTASRQIRRIRLDDEAQDGWEIDDLIIPSEASASASFEVSWQFAPGTILRTTPETPTLFTGERKGKRFTLGLDAAWSKIQWFPETSDSLGFPIEGDLQGLCSPAFRRIQSGPLIVLQAIGGNPRRYRTTITAPRE